MNSILKQLFTVSFTKKKIFKLGYRGVLVTSQQKGLFFCAARYENWISDQQASVFLSHVVHADSRAFLRQANNKYAGYQTSKSCFRRNSYAFSFSPNFFPRASITRYTLKSQETHEKESLVVSLEAWG